MLTISLEQNTILDDVNQYLKTTYHYKKDPAYLCDKANRPENFRIMANRKRFDLYIRFGLYHTSSNPIKSVVLARIYFSPERCKHGSNFLKFITKLAIKYDYECITIESTNKNSAAFATRFGFSPDEYLKPNYNILTEKLDSILDNY